MYTIKIRIWKGYFIRFNMTFERGDRVNDEVKRKNPSTGG
ncbi:hypothetical protein I33_2128 [Bacillus subtilis subsp. subtilis str. RO-NN-1]|nr:hypothetical protein I33_2128 [Bacillus subtilis subsp. subtilis str. RO-NN-1]